MRLIPFAKCVIKTDKTKSEVLRILRMHTSTPANQNNSTSSTYKIYIGHVLEDGFSISPHTSFSNRSSIVMRGRFIENAKHVSIAVGFTWRLLDYIFHGTILVCLGVMNFFCIRHACHTHSFQACNLLPPLVLLLAYFTIMTMFNMSIKYRKQELLSLFTNPYKLV